MGNVCSSSGRRDSGDFFVEVNIEDVDPLESPFGRDYSSELEVFEDSLERKKKKSTLRKKKKKYTKKLDGKKKKIKKNIEEEDLGIKKSLFTTPGNQRKSQLNGLELDDLSSGEDEEGSGGDFDEEFGGELEYNGQNDDEDYEEDFQIDGSQSLTPGVIDENIFTSAAPPPPAMPPPPPMGMDAMPMTPPPVLPSKSLNTCNIRVGLIPKKRLKKSIYKRDRLLQKGTKKWGSKVKQVLEEKFQIRAVDENEEVRDRGRSMKNDEEPLVSSSKSLNAAIGCSKIENKDDVLEMLKLSKKWLYTTPEGFEVVFRIKQIAGIFKEEEKKQLSLMKEEKSKMKLSSTDRFILGLLTEVPYLGMKLEVFEFLESCKSVFEYVKPELERICKFCKVLMKSEKFKNFLSLVLVITNFLNQTSEETENKLKLLSPESKKQMEKKLKKKGVHYGLSVRSLLNLARVKNPENTSESLIDVIFSIILKEEPETLEFREEFTVVQAIVDGSQLSEIKDSFKKFTGSVSKMTKHLEELEKVQKEGKLFGEDEIVPFLTIQLEEVNKEVEEMSKMIRKSDSRIEEISDAYGHERDSISDFFITLNDFLKLLSKAEEKHERMVKRKEREEKRRRKKEEKMMKLRQKELEESLNVENTPERANVVSILSRNLFVEDSVVKKEGKEEVVPFDEMTTSGEESEEEESEEGNEEEDEEREDDEYDMITLNSPFCAEKKWDKLIEEAQIRVEESSAKKKDRIMIMSPRRKDGKGEE